MADALNCDICGAAMTWTADEVVLDLSLRRMGLGLGAMCTLCSAVEADRADAEYEAEERRRLEDEDDV